MTTQNTPLTDGQDWREKLLLDEAEAADVLGVAAFTLKAARLRKLKPGHPLMTLPHVRIGKAPKPRRRSRSKTCSATNRRGRHPWTIPRRPGP